MKKLVFICFGLVALVSCIDHSRQKAWKVFYDGPTTKKEKEYYHELKSHGFSDIDFAVPIIDRTSKYGGQYGLTVTLEKRIDSTNLDSIKKVRDGIANYLYTTIIADSTLMVVSQIKVNIKIPKGYYPKGDEPFLYDSFYKDSLAKKNGFKVIRTGKNTYRRIPYWEKVRKVYTK